MCSTCDYKNFERVILEQKGRTTEVLQQTLGDGNLVMRYDPNAKKHYLAVNGESNSEFRAYRCPTCGKNLYEEW